MVKCPNCGSTAQVKRVSPPYLAYENEQAEEAYYYEETYTCGCGCNFIAHFPRVVCDYTILRKGDNNG